VGRPCRRGGFLTTLIEAHRTNRSPDCERDERRREYPQQVRVADTGVEEHHTLGFRGSRGKSNDYWKSPLVFHVDESLQIVLKHAIVLLNAMTQTGTDLRCLFSGKIRRDSNGDFVVTIPTTEIDHGPIQPGNCHQIGIFDEVDAEPGAFQGRSRDPDGPAAQGPPSGEPPVEEGEELTVKIEGKGEEGDGVAKVPPGYVIMVPETEVGEEVKIQVTATRENVGFGTVVGRLG